MNYLQTGLANARQELKSPMFDRTEPSRSSGNLLSQTDSTPSIDITKTFSSKPHYITIPLKLFLLTWVLAMLGVSISSYEYRSFWLAYLTNWGWTFTCAYFVFSLGTALYLMRFGEEGKASDVFVKVTWALFAIVLPAEIVIAGLYWSLLFSGYSSYTNIMLHGVGVILILIDGFIINRAPLRMKQFVLYETFAVAYTLWSIIFSYSDLTNPWQEAGYQDDDAIYPPLRWKTNTISVIVLCAILFLVVNPAVFLVCRWISRMLPMRLGETEPKNDEVELADADHIDQFVVDSER